MRVHTYKTTGKIGPSAQHWLPHKTVWLRPCRTVWQKLNFHSAVNDSQKSNGIPYYLVALVLIC